ncbi:MAG: hypothetical protein ABI665_04680 [Vicinamibacterales bacterium]
MPRITPSFVDRHRRRLRQIESGVGADALCQPKIQYLHRAIGGNRDVRGLQIAVDDPFFVRHLEGFGDLSRDGERHVDG